MCSRLLENVLLYPRVSPEPPGSNTHIYDLKTCSGLDLSGPPSPSRPSCVSEPGHMTNEQGEVGVVTKTTTRTLRSVSDV